jgi:hypothetical protein
MEVSTELRLPHSVASIVRNQRADSASLALLTKSLTTESTEVRLNIVRLLEKTGLAMDLSAPDKFPIIRNHDVMRALLAGGFAKDDAATSLAATILTDRCKASDLAAFGTLYIDSLRQSKGLHLYIVAKAKTLEARPLVEKMASQPAWRDEAEKHRTVQIAQAALGNTKVEDGFINGVVEAEKTAPPAPKNRFYNVGEAKDGTELAKRLERLGSLVRDAVF